VVESRCREVTCVVVFEVLEIKRLRDKEKSSLHRDSWGRMKCVISDSLSRLLHDIILNNYSILCIIYQSVDHWL